MSIIMHGPEGGCLEPFTIRFCLHTWNRKEQHVPISSFPNTCDLTALLVFTLVGCAQEQIYFNRIQDSDEDILGAILRTFNAAPKYNPTLLQSDTDSAADTPQQVRQWICASQCFLLFIKTRRFKSFLLERALCATRVAMLL